MLDIRLGATEMAGVMTPLGTHFGTFRHIRGERPETHETPRKPLFSWVFIKSRTLLQL
jgi:hypothetical protein